MVEGTNWKGDKSAYTYNGLGLRINNTHTTHAGKAYTRDYVIDYTSFENDDLMVYAEGNGQLEYEQKHVYAGSERIEQFTDKGNWERTLYVHEDVMGNTRYYTKANGQSFAELTYDAWGMPESPNKLLNNDHGNYVFATFTGHIYDTTLDIYFAEARFYDANNRTWLAVDPVKDGLNWYQYCYSNPTTYFDPLGLWGTTTGSKQAQLSGSSIEIPGFIKRLLGNLFSFIAGLGSSISKMITFGLLPDAPITDFETAYYLGQATGSAAFIALGLYLGLGGLSGNSAAVDVLGNVIVISQAKIALAGSIIVVDGGLVFKKGLENLIQEFGSTNNTDSSSGTGKDNPLLENWGEGGRGSSYNNASIHYDKHGIEVGA